MNVSRVVKFWPKPMICPISSDPMDRLSKMEAIVTATIMYLAASSS
jgi:hypothetical protein